MSATIEDATEGAAESLADHHPIGISTGVFAGSRKEWPVLVDQARSVSTFAVELSALSGDELPSLMAYLKAEPRIPFRYVSVHAPVKNHHPDEATSVRQLAELPLWVRSVVTHPDALADPERYRVLGTRLVLENMDARKETGRVADEMASFFDLLPEAGFCLDIAHAHSIDPSMAVAQELLDHFRTRLRHVHLSSLQDGHHVPLTESDEEQFIDVLGRCRDVPWILEAPPPERWAEQLKAKSVVTSGTMIFLG